VEGIFVAAVAMGVAIEFGSFSDIQREGMANSISMIPVILIVLLLLFSSCLNK